MTSINHDDPRLTAYVLGELDSADAQAVQQAAQDDPKIKAELDAIGRLSSQLKSEMTGQGPLALTADQKRHLEAAMAGKANPLRVRQGGASHTPPEGSPLTRSPDFWRGAAALSGMAALVALGIFLPRSLFDGGSVGSGLAINEPSSVHRADSTESSALGHPKRSSQLDQSQGAQDRFAGGLGEGGGSDFEDAVKELEGMFGAPTLADSGVAGELDVKVMTDGLDPATKTLGRSSDTPADLLTTTNGTTSSSDAMRKQVAGELRHLKEYDSLVRDQSRRSAPTESMYAAKGAAPPRRGLESRSRSRQEPNFGESPELGLGFIDVGKEARVNEIDPNTLPIDSFTDSLTEQDDFENVRATIVPSPPVVHNPFVPVIGMPLSTFSIDVDTASYSNMRGYLRNGEMPPPSIARVEEMINYFSYNYAAPSPGDEHPFLSHAEVAPCPWSEGNRLVRLGIKGLEIPRDDRPATNLVFLVDVSGSMSSRNKLPLVKDGLKMMVENLTVDDKVALVTYAGHAGVVLESTSCFHRDQILAAIDNLGAGGSTHGSQGIQRAYEIAASNFIEGGMNRVILATDGDFNVGITDNDALVGLIEDEAKSGVFLNVLGFGRGNLKDARLEQLADKGNGVYAYIDDIHEARKVFVDEMSGTLVTIAKDVKIQVEFNPAAVKSYRLIGYENRMLAARDFNDDTKDAGEIGAGHTVTALYEVVPGNGFEDLAAVDAADDDTQKAAEPQAAWAGIDPLRYQSPADDAPVSDEWLTVKIRYKQPDSDESTLIEYPVTQEDATRAETFGQASDDFRFATSVAAMGMILRHSPYVGDIGFNRVLGWAMESLGDDKTGDRLEFVELVKQASALAGNTVSPE